MRLKKLTYFVLFLITIQIANINAQTNSNCPDSTCETKFAKIMDLQFAKDYKDCILKTKAVFLGTGSAGYRIPSKLKDLVVFRCYPEGVIPENNPLTGSPTGNFVFVDKKASEFIFDLKQGDIVQLIGSVYVNNNFGYQQSNFIATQIKKIEK